jgi:hypothetical protein
MLDTLVTAVLVLPMVHVFSTQTVAEFYRRRSKANLDKSDPVENRPNVISIEPRERVSLWTECEKDMKSSIPVCWHPSPGAPVGQYKLQKEVCE